VDPIYKARKWLEEKISIWTPSLGCKTKYSRVSFENERYSEVIRRSERQGRLLAMGILGPVSVGRLVRWEMWGRELRRREVL
jgi:kynurenine 3-monooxygenase